MRPRRIALHHHDARDRRKCAIHEAGHYVVARHLGLRSAAAWIVRRTDVTDLMADRLWEGFTSISSAELNQISTRRVMMYGVAGVVAEEAWSLRHGSEDSGWLHPEDLLAEGGMSETDWATARSTPCRVTPKLLRAVEDVQKLLQPGAGLLWCPLYAVARALILDGFCETRPGVAAAAREHT